MEKQQRHTIILFIIIVLVSLGYVAVQKYYIEKDIEIVDEKIKEKSNVSFLNTNSKTWNSDIKKLKQDAIFLDNVELQIRIQELLASLGQYNTELRYSVNEDDNSEKRYSQDMHVYPISLKWIGDDLLIESAAYEYKDIVGSRLTEINNMKIEDVISKISKLVSYENKAGLRYRALEYMTVYEYLRYYQVIDIDEIEIKIKDRYGEVRTRRINPIRAYSFIDLEDKNKLYKMTIPNSKNKSIPFKRGEKVFDDYEYTYVKNKILYIKIKSLLDDGYLKFDESLNELLKYKNGEIDKVVLDLRDSHGGKYSFANRIVDTLKVGTGDKNIKYYVLINGGTYSSSIDLAFLANKDLKAKVIGGDITASPVSSGEVKAAKLSELDCLIRYCTRLYDQAELGDVQNKKSSIILSGNTLKTRLYLKQKYNNYIRGIDDFYEYVVNDN
ncbi:MAG: S41 family peptidase [Clostridioides sp.]|jgi:C-terminal processing protease CtpA/Prc|nr:S41 family peptidase [Clostridioides sp.]